MRPADSREKTAMHLHQPNVTRLEPRALAATTVFIGETVTRLAPAAQLIDFTNCKVRVIGHQRGFDNKITGE
jgi:hypothetical protein